LSRNRRAYGIYSVLVFPGLGGSHSGLVRPPAKRVGAVEVPRGFESLPLRRSSSTVAASEGEPSPWVAPPAKPPGLRRSSSTVAASEGEPSPWVAPPPKPPGLRRSSSTVAA